MVANPPYVSAHEGSDGLLKYRNDVENEHPFSEVRSLLNRKWDLFVPFVGLAHLLLKEGGYMGMITSNAIEVVPYAEDVRLHLVEDSKVIEVSFFPGERLFEDAAVENTIFFRKKRGTY